MFKSVSSSPRRERVEAGADEGDDGNDECRELFGARGPLAEDFVERTAVLGIPVADEEPDVTKPLPHRQVASLLGPMPSPGSGSRRGCAGASIRARCRTARAACGAKPSPHRRSPSPGSCWLVLGGTRSRRDRPCEEPAEALLA